MLHDTLLQGQGAIQAGLAAPIYPVRFDVPPQHQHRRLTVLLRWLLVLPYALATTAIGYIVYPLTLVSWFAIVLTGRFPAGLWNFSAKFLLWRARLYVYAGLLRDEYPPFGYSPYPILLEIDFAARRSRLRTFFRALLVLPQLVATYAVSLALYACMVLAWVSILATGTYPEGIRRFVVGAIRWLLRLEAYLLLLIDPYPPFSLGLSEPSSPSATPPAPPEAQALSPALAPLHSEPGVESDADATQWYRVPAPAPEASSLPPPAEAETSGDTKRDAPPAPPPEEPGFYRWTPPRTDNQPSSEPER